MKQQTIDGRIWTKVASGDLGDQVDWEPGFESLGNVYWLLCRVGETDEDRIHWDELIGDHTYFDCLRGVWPPFGNEADFEQYFSDFLAVTAEPDDSEMPGEAFASLDLFVANEVKDRVIKTFESFERHLRSLPVIQEAIA